MLLLFTNEKCPYCGEFDKGCAIEVEDISDIDKGREKESLFFDEQLGRGSGPRPVFLFSSNVCKRGIR